MELKKIPYNFTVCKIQNIAQVPVNDPFYFVSQTDEELSLVCLTENTPEETIEREDGWKAFRIQGVLDFSLIGILSKVAGILAEQSISIFAVSTFNTDYILVRSDNYESALNILAENGYTITD